MPTKSNNIGGRGGARPGAGRKKTAVSEKAKNGNPGGRKLEVLDIPEVEGVEMPNPTAGAQPLYCLGVKLTFWTVNGFVKICRRVSQMRFFHQTIKTFICPRLPLCINHCGHAFHKSV